MIQRLLVEGINDLHFVSNLALAMNFPTVKGYENAETYRTQFCKVANGKTNLNKQLIALLGTPNLTNLGVILDTDNETIEQNWFSITSVLQKNYAQYLPKHHHTEGSIIETPTLKIGIWMMPNNEREGYLEHFFEELIDQNDVFWQKATETTEEFIQDRINRFSPTHKQKADVHTWLSWQKSPESPMGLALNQQPGFFNFDAPVALKFKNWWAKTFELNI
jgi:hypothetical protein